MRRILLVALPALLAGGAAGAQEPLPKAELQLVADAVRLIKRDYAGPVDDAALATGCADALATAAGQGERTARALDAVPLLLQRAHAAVAGKADYRRLARACIQGMVGRLDSHSAYLDDAELRGAGSSAGSPQAAAAQASWLENGVLELRPQQFREGTRNELLRELARLAQSGQRPRGIVLDLRDNHGSLLTTAVDLAGLFLNDGTLLGTARGRNRPPDEYRAATRYRSVYYGPPIPDDMAVALRRAPLAVLVNQRTASGAEILAGALQANSRAILVGERTLGVGTIQSVFPLPGGGGLKLTSAHWHGPKDAGLEGKPLEPDVPAAAAAAPREALRWLQEFR